MSEPRTEAGKRLRAYRGGGYINDEDVAAIEAEARSAALAEVEALIVDAPCRHAADFGAGPDADPGPCLTEIDELLAVIQSLQGEPR